MNNNETSELIIFEQKQAQYKISEVLVTGASGFIGTHCVEILLKNGYRVRGTVRDLNNKAKVGFTKLLKAVCSSVESLKICMQTLLKNNYRYFNI